MTDVCHAVVKNDDGRIVGWIPEVGIRVGW